MDEANDERLWSMAVPANKAVVRLPAKAKNVIFWLAARQSPGPVPCVALVGAKGQLTLRPATAAPEAFKQVSSNLSHASANFGDERRRWFEIARLSTLSDLVKVSVEAGGRVSIYLPKAFADLDIGPKRGEVAVVIAIDEVLEVWSARVLGEWSKESGSSLDELERSALKEIDT